MKTITKLALLTILILSSCKEQDDIQTITDISVDVKNIELYNIDKQSSDFKIIHLEDSDESFIGGISRLQFDNDTIVVNYMDKIMTFKSNGEFITKIASKGRANNEYTVIGDINVDNGAINILDNSSKKVISYNLKGDFISQYSYSNYNNDFSISRSIPLNDSTNIAMHIWNGTPGTITPMLSFTDNKFKITKLDSTLRRESPWDVTNVFSRYDDKILHWNFMCDTIYQIDQNMVVRPRYSIDFGEYALPSGMKKDYDMVEYIYNNTAILATQVNYVSENDDILIFKFSHNKKEYCNLYNKKTKTNRVLEFELSDKEITSCSGLYKWGEYWVTVWDGGANPILVLHKF